MYVVKLEHAENQEEFGFKASTLSGLRKSGLPASTGFVITPRALELFINTNQIGSKIPQLRDVAGRSPAGLKDMEEKVRDLFVSSVIPSDLRNEISSAYGELSLSEDIMMTGAAFSMIRAGRNHELVAVRSSVIKDSVNSFAGVVDSFVNVNGEDDLFKHIKLCWASLFYPYIALYRERKGIGDVMMSVVVQKMADSEKSGIMLTSFGGDKILIEGSWGLGTAVTSGIVTPDEYLLDSDGSLIEKNIAKKLWMYSRNEMNGVTSKEHVPGSNMDAQVLSEAELKKLFELAGKVNSMHPGQQIIEWCVGRNRVMIHDVKPGNYDITPTEEAHPTGDILVTGRYVSRGNVTGAVKSISSSDAYFGADNIAVAGNSSCKELLSVLDVGGLITDEGGRLCNFGILARELQIPVLSATQNATSILKDGERVHLITQHGKVLSLPQEVPQEDPMIISTFPPLAETPQIPQSEPFHVPDASETQVPPPFVQESPLPSTLPADATGSAENASNTTKLFVKVGPDMIGRVQGANGYIVYQLQTDPSMLMDTTGSVPGATVWTAYNGEHDFHSTIELTKRLSESGNADTGLLVPMIRGFEDVEKIRAQLPVGVKSGVTIKTPAMALSLDSVVREGMAMVNIDFGSLSQLTMGLKEPNQDIHPVVLSMIVSLKERCREKGILCCVSLDSGHATDLNIEMLVRKGIDIICVEPGIVDEIRNALVRTEKKIALEPGASNDVQLPSSGEGNEEKPSVPFDFNSSFS